MNRRRRPLARKPSVETLERRQMLSLAPRPVGIGTREVLPLRLTPGASPRMTFPPRPDLDGLAWALAHQPRMAARMGLGELAAQLRRHAGFARRNGWGTCLAMELTMHPRYAAAHRLTALMTPPTPASPPVTPPPPTPSQPPTDSGGTPGDGGTGGQPPVTLTLSAGVEVGSTLDVFMPRGTLAGSDLTFTITPQPLLANMTFHRGTGELVFAPAPEQVGTHRFTVEVSDGKGTLTVVVPIEVTRTPRPTTEVSGRVVYEAGRPLAEIPVRIGSIETKTDAKGSFTLAAG